MHCTTKQSRIVTMGKEEDLTEQLRMRADYSVNVVRALEEYKQLGDNMFYLDRCNFHFGFDVAKFHEREDRQRLRDVFATIEDHMETYELCRDEVNDAILQMKKYPKRNVNDFARSLYVNILRGQGYSAAYQEEMVSAWKQLSVAPLNSL